MKNFKWRMDEPCDNCPFSDSEAGKMLASVVASTDHLASIQKVLLKGGHFICHKTTKETGDGSQCVCAGAIEWQSNRGIKADLVQIMERLDLMNNLEKDH